MDLTGRTIALTGASAGFGRTLAICFARAGAELFVSARTQDKANATAAIVREDTPGALVHAFEADMSDPGDIRAFAAATAALTPHLDILVHNAGFWLAGDFLSAGDADIIEAIDSTVTGTLLATRHFLPLLVKSPAADIVMINGTPGLPRDRHPTAHAAFSAAKAAQATFADRLRQEVRGSGIRVTTIIPPNFTNTSPLEAGWDARRPAGQAPGDYLTARNVVEAIGFALGQDRICVIEEIVMGNNGPA